MTYRLVSCLSSAVIGSSVSAERVKETLVMSTSCFPGGDMSVAKAHNVILEGSRIEVVALVSATATAVVALAVSSSGGCDGGSVGGCSGVGLWLQLWFFLDWTLLTSK